MLRKQLLKKIKSNWIKEFDKQLLIAERIELKNALKYYKTEYKKSIDLFLQNKTINGFNDLFLIRDFKRLYENIYVNVGLRFAKWYAKNFRLFIKKDINIAKYDTIWLEKFQNIAQIVGAERVTLVQGTAKETLKKVYKKLMRDPEFMVLNERVSGKILQSQFNKYSVSQAKRLIRTESTFAANFATHLSASDIFDKNQLQKEWITAMDERVRSSHANAHGQIVDFDKSFRVGGEFLTVPADPSGSASNIINCRCQSAPFPKPDEYDASTNEFLSTVAISVALTDDEN